MAKLVSLDALRAKEHKLLDNVYDGMEGLSRCTRTDRYMELNHGRMGEDSEELALRSQRTRKMLSERPLPSYQPF